MSVDMDNLPQAFWFDEGVTNLKVMPVASPGTTVEIDGQVLSEKPMIYLQTIWLTLRCFILQIQIIL